MRIGYTDPLGVFQVFEIRKVKTYEPDHYQELTCEHIVIAELTDEHCVGKELTNVTAQSALTQLLTGTLWQVGTVTASGTSSGDLSLGSVYQNIRTIENNWNVYILPRVTFNSSGITGRYLDITPAGGVWRGVRLSLDKNADEMGVTIDDTNTLTALYGYGKAVNGKPIDFSSVTWSQTSSHPAKTNGQKYLEDPEATALYGRNGRARFGYYQNGDISSPSVLLQKTWDALKATNKPVISIDCQVRDLYRLGYADQPLRYHDLAIVEIRQTGEKYKLEINRMTEDLIDPTATRVTIGQYIPNIIYISRDTKSKATGSRGGASGARGQTNQQAELEEFYTEIQANKYEISLKAAQRDLDDTNADLAATEIKVTAQGATISSHTTRLNQQGERITTAEAKIEVNAEAITSKVSKGAIASTINQTAQSVLIQASKINLSGYVTTSDLDSTNATISNLMTGNTTASKIVCDDLRLPSSFYYHGHKYVEKYITYRNADNSGSESCYVLSRS
jgi:phage minor structural protein